MPTQIELSAIFKYNLKQLPPVDALTRIDLESLEGTELAPIENQPGKQGSLAVYNYLAWPSDVLDAEAAGLGLALFAEHTAEARRRPGAHPSVDRPLEIVAGGTPLSIRVIGARN